MAIFMLLHAPLHASDMCPWFTQGSAAALLGSDVVATITAPTPKQGVCTFTREQDGGKDSIEIHVAMPASEMPGRCPRGSETVSGIGNEAVACTLKSTAGSVYQLDSRVRDLRFTVLLRVHKSNDGRDDDHSEKLTLAAEQVAGNLF